VKVLQVLRVPLQVRVLQKVRLQARNLAPLQVLRVQVLQKVVQVAQKVVLRVLQEVVLRVHLKVVHQVLRVVLQALN